MSNPNSISELHLASTTPYHLNTQLLNKLKSVGLIVGSLILIIWALFPFLIMLKSSFQPYEEIVSLNFKILPDIWFYWENYRLVIWETSFVRWFINSVLVTIAAIMINIVVDTLAGYSLSRLDFKGKNLLNVLVISSQMVPTQVIIIPLYLMMVELGWVDSYLGLIIPVSMSPFIIFYLRQSFMQIPKEIDEAALIDGCSYARILVSVIIPNALPALGTSLLLKFMWVWGDYMWPSLVVKNNAMRTLPVGIATFQRAGGTVPWEMVMPAAVITTIPIILMFIGLQKYFISGLTEGAVKG